MLNLILAIYYSNYKNRIEKDITKFIKIREDYLRQKFSDYDFDNKGYLNYDQCKHLICDLLRIRPNSNNPRNLDIEKMAQTFDMKCNGQIKADEFIIYFDLIDVVNFDNKQNDIAHKINSTHFGHKLRKVFKNPFYELCMIIVVTFSLLLLFVTDCMETYGHSLVIYNALVYCLIAIGFFFLLEMILMFYASGIIHTIITRNHIKLELLIQFIKLLLILDHFVIDNIDIEFKLLEICIISKPL